MDLTKEQAIAEHRKMWRWIAKETEKRQKKVFKEEYLKNYFKGNYCCFYSPLLNDCFLCEFCKEVVFNEKYKEYEEFTDCTLCPLDWGKDSICLSGKALFHLWAKSENWKEAAKLARQIAELPERKEK